MIHVTQRHGVVQPPHSPGAKRVFTKRVAKTRQSRVFVQQQEAEKAPGLLEVEPFPESPPPRLWSNLNPSTLKHEPGSVFGAAALVAGTTVGAGILALPAATQESGFVASSATLCGIWLFSAITGLLIAEININTMCELGSGGVSLTSMAERTLGKLGTYASSGAYVFLHYALLVAYISRGGEICADWLNTPIWVGGAAFAFSLGALCYAANTKVLNFTNSLLVALVVLTFGGLLFVGCGNVELENLARADWGAVPDTFSILSLAFVYHNIVPVITSDLEGDIRKVRAAIVFGTLVPLVMFVSWDATILGSISTMVSGSDPVESLKLSVPAAAPLIKSFSIFALATSYIGFVLGLTDFISDAMKLSTRRQPVPYAIVLFPSLGLALTFPDIFFKALDFAGTYGVLVLFGVLPSLMAWSERYGGSTVSSIQIVPGGRFVLLSVGGLAAVVILAEFLQLVGSYL